MHILGGIVEGRKVPESLLGSEGRVFERLFKATFIKVVMRQSQLGWEHFTSVLYREQNCCLSRWSCLGTPCVSWFSQLGLSTVWIRVSSWFWNPCRTVSLTRKNERNNETKTHSGCKQYCPDEVSPVTLFSFWTVAKKCKRLTSTAKGKLLNVVGR